MLLFAFLFNAFLLSQRVKCINKIGNISLIKNNTQSISTKSRYLAEIERPNNPHYYNDPELKEIIDKLNKEAIKKYQKNHDPYEQLKEVVEKNQTKVTGGNDAEPMSTLEKDLLEIYEKLFGDKSHIMIKSNIYINQDDKSNDKNDKSCECANYKKYNQLLSSYSVDDAYLHNLKSGCVACVGTSALSSIITGLYGISAASTAAIEAIMTTSSATIITKLTKSLFGINFFSQTSIESAYITAGITSVEGELYAGLVTSTFLPYGIVAIVLILVIVALIMLYIWFYRRRKSSWKYAYKNHLST
ncbi:hypothetical protein PFNF135_00699 [Plasmodium falciparum NF135/5.C10]|uniref:Stevor n=2 Tax=Plasmodium falciparum TaxID=5833 RepID=A0A024VE08_PLAFA|nr:hypothetical protein PFFVO_00635 [Plasmodium falciparum Vietnam Oak-Knoll (FVO)]ETW44924.1 hypothetical protein PFNF135_00699 [Plasmodium falciparum NF135/5.C10]